MARVPEEEIDEGVEETFPASDPPAHSTTPKSDQPVRKPKDDEKPHSPEGKDLERSKQPGATVISPAG